MDSGREIARSLPDGEVSLSPPLDTCRRSDSIYALMRGRNLAKPFAIVGFIVAEMYMFFTVAGPYGRETQPLPMPIPEVTTLPVGSPVPPSAKVKRIAVGSIFFGPFGALVGTGVGLLVSGLRGDFRKNSTPSKPADSDRSGPAA